MSSDIGQQADWGALRPGALGRAIIALSRNTPCGRGAGRRLLLRLLARVHGGAVDVSLWGAPVRLYPWNNASERKALMRPDQLDRTELDLLARTMREAPATFVDIGANAGLYSLRAALASRPGGRILAVEPNPALTARLGANLNFARQAGLLQEDVSVAIAAVAVGARDGAGVLAGAGGEGGRRLEAGGAGISVPVRPLAALLAEHGIARVDLMKIDVEGGEDRILPPFLAAAPETAWPEVLIIEHLSRAGWSVDCIAEFERRGYLSVATTRNNTILRRGR